MDKMNVISVDQRSTDPRDAGAGPRFELYQVADKDLGDALCAYLNAMAILARTTYMDWGENNTYKDRDQSYEAAKVFEQKVARWFPQYSVAYNYSFRVVIKPVLDMVDLAPFKLEMAQ